MGCVIVDAIRAKSRPHGVESPGNAARIAALSADQAPTANIGCLYRMSIYDIAPKKAHRRGGVGAHCSNPTLLSRATKRASVRKSA
jgi:hypothetical protein